MLVLHGFLLEFACQVQACRLMQRDGFFLYKESMGVDVFDRSEDRRQILSLGSDCLRVAWLQRFSKVLVLRLEIDL